MDLVQIRPNKLIYFERPEYMTPIQFTQWLAAMKAAGLIRFDNDAAKALGVTNDTIVNMTHKGTDTRTALACRALFHRLEPWA